MSIKDDLKNFPCYVFRHKRLIRLNEPPKYWQGLQAHHFIRKSLMKTNPSFFERVRHLQKIIFVLPQINYDLETMGEVKFYKTYGVNKNDLVFSRLKWREGYYDAQTK